MQQMETAQPFGKYLLMECVAVGGMAEIFRAKTVGADGFEKEVAIKRILPSYSEDDGFVTMFKDEAKIAAQLDHANIVKVFDFDEVGGDYYIAMEYIRGRDLKRLVETADKHNKRFTVSQILFMVIETAKALDYAHKRTATDGSPLNIVHRDVTPHNVMLGYNGDVKLMDFGIAKAASRATKTRAGTVKGKCAYMSPEQARGKPLDGRSDMFSLGIILWEMLTGKRLFAGGSDFDVLSKVLKSEIQSPRSIDGNVPEEVDRICMKMLDRDRDSRYMDCGELLQDLNSYFYSQCADAHNHNLAHYVQCLAEVNGHAPSELPDYQPGAGGGGGPEEDLSGEATQMLSLEEMQAKMGMLPGEDDGGSDVEQVQNQAATMALDQGAVNQHQPGMQQPGMQPGMQQGMQQTGMGYGQPGPYGGQMPYGGMGTIPPGAMGQMGYGQPQRKSNTGLIIAIVLVVLLIVGGGVAAIFLLKDNGKADAKGEKTAAADSGGEEGTANDAPVSYVTIKSMPAGASVTVNGTPNPKPTPIFGFEGKIGDKLKLQFELDGYEPLTVQRTLLQQSQTIEEELTPIETADASGSGDGESGTDSADTAPETSSLVIESDPDGSSVTIDGEKQDGKTPLTIDELPVDKELTIVVDPRGDYRRTVRKFTLTADGENVLSVKHKKKRDRHEDDEAGGVSELAVNAIPWGVVYLDGKRLGNTPIKKEVDSGRHKLEISFPAKNEKVKKTVKLRSGKKNSFTYDFNAGKWR